MLAPGDILVDCTGCKSLFRDHLVPGAGAADGGGNTLNIRLEYAIVVTFLYGRRYECNEFCKYYKNAENPEYKFIPAVDRTYYDGDVSHVTGIVNITAEDYAAMPPQFDGEWLRGHFPDVARSMDRFIDKVKQETHGEVMGDLEIVRIPMNLYRGRNATSRAWRTGAPSDHPFTSSPVFLLGDSAIGSPYFQSISLGFESAMFLAALLSAARSGGRGNVRSLRAVHVQAMASRLHAQQDDQAQQGLVRVVDDPLALLTKLHIY